MRRPTADDVAILSRPSWIDALLGATWAWLYVVLIAPLVIVAVTMVDRSTVMSPGSPFDLFFVWLFSVLYTAMFAGVVAFTVGLLLARLLAQVLARVMIWPVHLASYFALGVLTGWAVAHLAGFTSSAPGWLLGFLALGWVSVAAGWATAWAVASRRARRAPRETSVGESVFGE